jgi:tetratricopeptide (TPR) repeat protein
VRNLRIARLLTLLPALLAGLLAASMSWAQESYAPTEAEANKVSLQQATDFVQRGLSNCNRDPVVKVQVMPDIIKVSWPYGFAIWQFRELRDLKLSFIDSNAWISRASSLTITMQGHVFQDGREYSSYTVVCSNLNETWVKAIGDGLLRLKLEYDKSNDPENMAKFKEEALRYQAMNPKPELPEDARRFRVQAEGSVAAKRFLEAAERYGKAIEIAPWWPEAHFNRAVVLAELQNFDSAMAEMKRYLLLKPDAADARQAQDFIYAWEAHPFENK